MRRVFSHPLSEALAFLVAAAVWLAPLTLHPTSVAFWRGGAYSDLLISHWPNAILLHRGLFDAGRVPLWNPMVLSGTPFAADPLSGLWYPPDWLAALFPTALAFNILFWLHLAWAGWGAARLARAEGVGSAGSLLSGLAYSGAPKLIGHIGLGHLGLVESVCWTPWVLLAAGSTVDSLAQPGGNLWRKTALAGSLLGVTFLADPRWAVPAAMAAIAYAIARIARSHTTEPGARRLVRLSGAAALFSAFALGISGALAIPLWEFIGLSTRASLAPLERASLSLPLTELVSFVVPDFGGWPEWLVYPGIAVIVLSALAFAGSKSKALFWWGVALAAVMLAVGPALPIYPVAIAVVPGLSLLRVPARFLLLVPLGLAIAAGLGVNQLLGGHANARSRRNLFWIGAIISLLILTPSIATAITSGDETFIRARALAGIALTMLVFAWIGTMLRGTIGSRIGMVGLVFLVGADLILMSVASLRIVASAESLQGRAGVVDATVRSAGGGRALSPSYSLPQPAATIAGLELADGIDPLQLAGYRQYMSESLGFSPDGYSVTLPPFPDGNPSSEWPVRLDLKRLGLLSVATVVSEFPLKADGLVFESSIDGAYVYRNEQARPRAWVQPSPVATEEWRPVAQFDRSVDDIHIRATGPGTLVISEIVYPGWAATIDGDAVPIETVFGVLRGVELSAGAHDVEFEFRPTSVYAGWVLSLLTVLALAWLWIRR